MGVIKFLVCAGAMFLVGMMTLTTSIPVAVRGIGLIGILFVSSLLASWIVNPRSSVRNGFIFLISSAILVVIGFPLPPDLNLVAKGSAVIFGFLLVLFIEPSQPKN